MHVPQLDPGDGWRITDRELDGKRLGTIESILAVGNGHLGVRGAPVEGAPADDAGVILNGFHETWPIVYPENAYGLAHTGQTIVPPPDGSIIRLTVDGERIDPSAPAVVRCERTLDMRAGVLVRELEIRTARGTRVLVRSRRLASLVDRHLIAIDYEVVVLDGSPELVLSSELAPAQQGGESDDPRRGKRFAERVLLPVRAHAAGTRAALQLVTRHSGLGLACGMEHAVTSTAPVAVKSAAAGEGARVELRTKLEAGGSLRLAKFVAYHWAAGVEVSELAARVDLTLARAATDGYDAVELGHRRRVKDFWQRSDVVLDGDPELQLAVRFNLFALMQATACAEGLGVAAKGVTGRGYEGHYFWDSEIYVVPFLAHTSPAWARRLLEFRCDMLDAARRRAAEVGHRGALYPWRTIDGREASAWYAAGTAQYHIDADIAYAMHHYNRVTGDLEFMLDRGAEVLVETARLWMDLGFFSERRGGRFCLNGVTGPDEYTTVVDNNAYTNLMAKENLEVATRVVEWLEATDPAAAARLARDTGVTDAEVETWRRAAEAMFVPRHDELGLVLQDEHFLDRERWDFAGTSAAMHPLLLHYHPLELYRHQVIKQTDVVLATYLVGHHFDADEKRRTFDYYDPLTTGDSTLSACVQSVMASEIGYEDAALDYFTRACMVDLGDLHGNTADGLHIASCGGTWLALVAGFAGLRDADGELRFAPRLPADWNRLRFRLQVRGQLLEVEMAPGVTTYRLLDGSGLIVEHFGERLRVLPGTAVERRGIEPVARPEAA
jgi:alpha,alpha-trehalose phosphorylase